MDVFEKVPATRNPRTPDPSLTLTRMQCPAIVGKAENRKPVARADTQTPATLTNPRPRTRKEVLGQRFESARRLPTIGVDKGNTQNNERYQRSYRGSWHHSDSTGVFRCCSDKIVKTICAGMSGVTLTAGRMMSSKLTVRGGFFVGSISPPLAAVEGRFLKVDFVHGVLLDEPHQVPCVHGLVLN